MAAVASRIAAIVGVAVALGGCELVQEPNPRFCCLSAQSCMVTGADEITPCRDPARPYCDEEGEYVQRFTCTINWAPDAGVDAGVDASEALE
jgi:hypothetical protein